MEPRLGHELIAAFALFAILLRLIVAFTFLGSLGALGNFN